MGQLVLALWNVCRYKRLIILFYTNKNIRTRYVGVTAKLIHQSELPFKKLWETAQSKREEAVLSNVN